MTISADNIRYLSALAQYNSERRTGIRRYFDAEYSTDSAHTIENIREWLKENAEPDESDFSLESINRLVLLAPGDVNPQQHQFYLHVRYSEVDGEEVPDDGFRLSSLLSVEALMRDQILSESDEPSDPLSQIHQPSDYEEFLDATAVVEPPDEFVSRWGSQITLDLHKLRDEYIDSVLPINNADKTLEVLSEFESILEFLTHSPTPAGQEDYKFILKPLISVDEGVAVPFPQILITTAQYRIEQYLSTRPEAQRLENQTKGDTVEALAFDALSQIQSRNFVSEVNYIHRGEREADGLLVFENSYWAVEVKSHPLFRRLPSDSEAIRKKFLDKVGDAVKQGSHFLNYLNDSVSDFGLLYNVSGEKSVEDMDEGLIVVLDGYLPTLFSGNLRADSKMGFGSIHDIESKPERTWVVSLYDLFQLLEQPEIESFEDFLRWRTDYGDKHPLWSFNERDYWSFYFDNFRTIPGMPEAMEEGAEKEIIGIYNSNRFNSKDHLENITDI